jgi:hypothetical protein
MTLGSQLQLLTMTADINMRLRGQLHDSSFELKASEGSGLDGYA